jgi:YVTN family beta-propeller protein
VISPTATPTPSGNPDVLAAIDAGRGPCAMVADGNSVWVTSYYENIVARIDGATNEVSETIKLGKQPCGVASAENKLWVSLVG